MAGRTGAGIANEDLSAASGEEGQYSKRGWQDETAGNTDIKDRVAQMAAVIVLEAIFEADLMEEQYAYRRKRSGLGAVGEVHELLNRGYKEVVDADLSSYFDTIPHHELMQSVARRVSDGAVLALVKRWLEMAVEEEDSKGKKQRSTVNKDKGRGTPQGAPIAPLLANLYMRRFLLGWKTLGWEERLQARMVNYADDFVILCRGSAEQAKEVMEKMMQKLKLEVNQKKTRLCRILRSPLTSWATGWEPATARRPESPISGPNPRRNEWPDCVRRSVK